MEKSRVGRFIANGKPCSLGQLLTFIVELRFVGALSGQPMRELFLDFELADPMRKMLADLSPGWSVQSSIDDSVEYYPGLDDSMSEHFYDYDCFHRIVKLYQEYPNLMPSLEFQNELRKKAAALLPSDKIVASVHLKTVGPAGESVANQDVWYEFFRRSAVHFPQVHFVVVGKDNLKFQSHEFSNMMIAKERQADLAMDLALISLSDIFLGMSSGLEQVEILSKIQYIIFKETTHHADLIAQLLDADGRLPFARPGQQFFRENESVERLMESIKTFLAREGS